MTDEWEERLARVWAAADEYTDEELRSRIEELAAELPPGDAVAAFERGGSFDSTGDPERAVALYREALARGLAGERRRRAIIQLASSLRNLGRAEESVQLLSAESKAGSDELDDAVRAFLAVSTALEALAPHLPRYQRSLANYARLLRAHP